MENSQIHKPINKILSPEIQLTESDWLMKCNENSFHVVQKLTENIMKIYHNLTGTMILL